MIVMFTRSCPDHIPTAMLHNILRYAKPVLEEYSNIFQVDNFDTSFEVQTLYGKGDIVNIKLSENTTATGMVEYVANVIVTNLNTREEIIEIFPVLVRYRRLSLVYL
jgi:hypothetical protein